MMMFNRTSSSLRGIKSNSAHHLTIVSVAICPWRCTVKILLALCIATLLACAPSASGQVVIHDAGSRASPMPNAPPMSQVPNAPPMSQVGPQVGPMAGSPTTPNQKQCENLISRAFLIPALQTAPAYDYCMARFPYLLVGPPTPATSEAAPKN
jgi:hypothetical protein